ncbi:sarcosine oxidase subunit gamma [Streptomyces beihaiensis]|uniref:Sarcosine oxidase subunit gamma n=1 Tax=Streptomyces beihaiensis TaxID=2984495 RepID=A0ABT3TSD3_9ACTN|nr:sarcosine oxidase subunit gamma family protein [Streptomyces beihaiensis]MCX3059416.1 sarcosine oxidase subunit gamma [Streptomyces beihaiensis]
MTADTPVRPVRTSPLHTWGETFASLPGGLRVRELPFLTQLTLRVTPGSPAARAVEKHLGHALPGACRAHLDADVKALWLGPDEWLLVAPADRAEELTAGLRAAIGDEFATVTDTSAQRTVLSLTGDLVPDILAHGCALDLVPRGAGAGACHTTLLAQAGVTLVVREEGPHSVWLLVRSSFAAYLAAWLVDACVEYGDGTAHGEHGGGT